MLMTFLGLNYYEITVINGTVYMKLAGSYSRLEGTSSKPNNGLLQFLDDDGYLVTKQPYGVDSNTADTISEVTANLVPAGESYVRPYWQNGLYYFGQANSTLNMIEGLWRKSDNLQNWTVNLAQGFTNNLAVVSPAPATDEYDGIALQPQTHFKIRWCKRTFICREGFMLTALHRLDFSACPSSFTIISLPYSDYCSN
jgi:hypothetical protein